MAIVVDTAGTVIGDFRPWLERPIHWGVLRSLRKLDDLAVHLDFETGNLVTRDFDAGALMVKTSVNTTWIMEKEGEISYICNSPMEIPGQERNHAAAFKICNADVVDFSLGFPVLHQGWRQADVVGD